MVEIVHEHWLRNVQSVIPKDELLNSNGCIYVLRNTVTRKIYVGKTNYPLRRYRQHLIHLHTGKHPVADMQADYDEYGDHFQFVVVDTIRSYQDRFKEKAWMRKLKTYERNRGYNYQEPALKKVDGRTRYYFDYEGEQRSVRELSDMSGLSVSVLSQRLLVRGWTIEKAMNTKYDARKDNGKRRSG